jgi:hypothetical protein
VTVHTDDGIRLAGIVRRPTRRRGRRPAATAREVPGSGHAESGETGPLVERIGRWASETING